MTEEAPALATGQVPGDLPDDEEEEDSISFERNL